MPKSEYNSLIKSFDNTNQMIKKDEEAIEVGDQTLQEYGQPIEFNLKAKVHAQSTIKECEDYALNNSLVNYQHTNDDLVAD